VEQIATLLKPITNPRMSSDLITAAALAHAALAGALANVDVNLESIEQELAGQNSPQDQAFTSQTRNRAAALKESA
jgi:formiminotetrahydrofolate cyclodeaminase